MDDTLLNAFMSLPRHLRMPDAMSDHNALFGAFGLHTATICLHQAAIFKVDRDGLPSNLGSESKRRCLVAAEEISNLMKSACHLDFACVSSSSAFELGFWRSSQET